jgi:quercetin dioxygenase-like cupin family protein
VHPDGERRPRGLGANRNATTISVLIHGTLRVTFEIDGESHTVTLAKEGDYMIFGRDMRHAWEAIGHTVVLSVRFPSVEVKRAAPGGEAR